MHNNRIAIIGIANGLGAGNCECQDGPEFLKALRFISDVSDSEHVMRWDTLIRVNRISNDSIENIANVLTRLSERVRFQLASGNFPIVIGGDHSCAIGTWSGVKSFIGENSRLGLIWIDAHMDSHTFQTSPSKNIHGMPLACLLGHGEKRLTEILTTEPKILPQDLCLIGIRSFESGEYELLRSLGVRIFFMEEVQRRGMSNVFSEAVNLISKDTVGYGISLDLDAIDPKDTPGVGTPVPGGLHSSEVVESLIKVHQDQRLLAIEIVEYNPYCDKHFVTAEAIHNFCNSMVL